MTKHAKLGFFAVIVSIALAFFAAQESWARPASPFPFKTTQPDGTEIEIYLRGDERLNWVEDPKGYTLAKNEKTGYWEYALLDVRSADVGGKARYRLVLIPSGVVYSPTERAPDGWPTRLRPTRAADNWR